MKRGLKVMFGISEKVSELESARPLTYIEYVESECFRTLVELEIYPVESEKPKIGVDLMSRIIGSGALRSCDLNGTQEGMLEARCWFSAGLPSYSEGQDNR
jgi:hypothetical protein